MEIDQDEERSVWNFGNYLRTALFLLFACAILSHDRTDLALLEGGIGGPAIYLSHAKIKISLQTSK